MFYAVQITPIKLHDLLLSFQKYNDFNPFPYQVNNLNWLLKLKNLNYRKSIVRIFLSYSSNSVLRHRSFAMMILFQHFLRLRFFLIFYSYRARNLLIMFCSERIFRSSTFSLNLISSDAFRSNLSRLNGACSPYPIY